MYDTIENLNEEKAESSDLDSFHSSTKEVRCDLHVLLLGVLFFVYFLVCISFLWFFYTYKGRLFASVLGNLKPITT